MKFAFVKTWGCGFVCVCVLVVGCAEGNGTVTSGAEPDEIEQYKAMVAESQEKHGG